MAKIKDVVLSIDSSTSTEEGKEGLKLIVNCEFTQEEIKNKNFYFLRAAIYEEDANVEDPSNESNLPPERELHVFKWIVGKIQNSNLVFFTKLKRIEATKKEVTLETVDQIDRSILNEDPGSEIHITHDIIHPFMDEFYAKVDLLKKTNHPLIKFEKIDSRNSESVTGNFGL